MKKETKMVYVYIASCIDCNASIGIFYTIPDYGDSPVIKKCKYCGELYWYTPEDEAYIQPINKQLIGKMCEGCHAELINALVPTHKNIQCCGTEFSLDDDFAGYNIPPVKDMVPLVVNLVYS